jgi:hypothetical protein
VLNYSGVTRGIHVSFPVNGTWEDLLSGWKINVGNCHWYKRRPQLGSRLLDRLSTRVPLDSTSVLRVYGFSVHATAGAGG